MYNHLLFDADGTLYDFDNAQKFALASLFEDLGLGTSSAVFATYEKVNSSLWQQLEAGTVTIETLKIERFRQFFEVMQVQFNPYSASKKYLEYLGSSDHIYPWTKPLITSLRSEGYTISLITNGIASVQRGRLAATKSTDLYDNIYISEEIGVQKPDPRFFIPICPTEQDRRKSLIIGDSLTSDIAGGNAAHIDTCWFNPSKSEANGAIPNYEIHAMEELQPLLSRLNR